jgi:hypothetical protein
MARGSEKSQWQVGAEDNLNFAFCPLPFEILSRYGHTERISKGKWQRANGKWICLPWG